MARTAHGTELDASAIGGGGDGGYARYREAHGEMPELPPGQRGKICRSRNDRGGASGSVFRAGFVFRGDAAALEGSRRAGGKNRPDFSEMQCYTCHHSLTPPEQSWRQARGYPGRRPGDPPWNAARYAVFRDVVQELASTQAHPLDNQVTQVTALMSALNPDREAVAMAAANVSRTAEAVVGSVQGAAYDPAATLRLLRKICGDADEISGEGEQSAAQAAMAIQSLFVAYDRDAKLANSADIRTAISALFQQLQTPSSYDPRSFSRQMQQVNALLR